MLDLLLKSRVEPDLIFTSLRGRGPYFLERKVASDVVALAKQKGSTIVVHSELGNGKSLLLQGVGHRVAESGRRVYQIGARTDALLREIDAVLSGSPDALILIDDYSEWLDIAEYLGMHAGPELSYLVSARTTTNDVRIDDLAAFLQRDKVMEVSVDRLVDPDVNWIDQCLSHYGLWGERASWAPLRRRKYLQERCGSQFNGVCWRSLKSAEI
jgi:hypothetical protein